MLLPCDVTKDEEIARAFAEIGGKFGKLHLLLHSVAFAPREALEGAFIHTSREAFRVAHDVSAYSLVALARAAAPLMTEGGSIVAMSYYGAEKVVAHYNVMGVAKAALEACTRYLAYDLGPKKIRVNCISAGPVNTVAARGIAGFSDMLKHYEAHAPLKRNVLPDELGAPGPSWPAMAPPPSRGRPSTSIAATKSWGCSRCRLFPPWRQICPLPPARSVIFCRNVSRWRGGLPCSPERNLMAWPLLMADRAKSNEIKSMNTLELTAPETRTANEREVIEFPDGLLGFEDVKSYV